MRGHEGVIKMRMNGLKPKSVFVVDYTWVTDWENPGAKYSEVWRPDCPTVCTVGDAIELLDLRFLVGLVVIISATSGERAEALFERAKSAGAKQVVASHGNVQTGIWDETLWFGSCEGGSSSA